MSSRPCGLLLIVENSVMQSRRLVAEVTFPLEWIGLGTKSYTTISALPGCETGASFTMPTRAWHFQPKTHFVRGLQSYHRKSSENKRGALASVPVKPSTGYDRILRSSLAPKSLHRRRAQCLRYTWPSTWLPIAMSINPSPRQWMAKEGD